MQALTPMSVKESGRPRSPLPVGYVTPGFILLSNFYAIPQSKGMLNPRTRKSRALSKFLETSQSRQQGGDRVLVTICRISILF